MNRFGRGRKVSISLVFALIAIPSSPFAYEVTTHYQTVIDAFNYIIESAGGPQTRYIDGWTPQKDYRLLSVLTGTSKSSLEDIRATALAAGKLLAQVSESTDSFTDVAIDIGLPLIGNIHSIATTFSHFVNIRTPGFLWPTDGYYFHWVKGNKECEARIAVDHLANLIMRYPWANVDTFNSLPYSRYRGQLSAPAEYYRRNFQEVIGNVRFWPAYNMAEYWFTEFLRAGEMNGRPSDLQHLGFVLHIAEDMTVPYHAIGMSGCGHSEYEIFVETLYGKNRALYDPRLVQNHLKTHKFLDSAKSVREIILGIAKYAGSDKFCKCVGIYCDCPLQRVHEVREAARDLINLAIAANVVLVRKGLSEWQKMHKHYQGALLEYGLIQLVAERQDKPPKVSPELIDKFRRQEENKSIKDLKAEEGQRLPPKTEREEPKTRKPIDDLTTQIVRTPTSLKGITGPTSSVQVVSAEVSAIMDNFKQAVAAFTVGNISEDNLRATMKQRVSDIQTIFEKHETVAWLPHIEEETTVIWPGLPPVLKKKLVEFRLPTDDEIGDDRKWSRYVEERSSYIYANELVESFVTRSALEVMRKREPREEQRRLLAHYISKLSQIEDNIITLASQPRDISQPRMADMISVEVAMMKATGEDLIALKKELAALQFELQRLTARTGAMTKMIDRATSNYCGSVPDSLREAGFAPGLCK